MTEQQKYILKEISDGACAIAFGGLFGQLSRWHVAPLSGSHYSASVPIADLSALVDKGYLTAREIRNPWEVVRLAYELTEAGRKALEGT